MRTNLIQNDGFVPLQPQFPPNTQYSPPNTGYQQPFVIVVNEPQTKFSNVENISAIDLEISKIFKWYIICLWLAWAANLILFIIILVSYSKGSETPGDLDGLVQFIFIVSLWIFGFYLLGYSIGISGYLSKSYLLNSIFRAFLFVMILPVIILNYYYLENIGQTDFTNGIAVLATIYGIVGLIFLIGFIYGSRKLSVKLIERARFLNGFR